MISRLWLAAVAALAVNPPATAQDTSARAALDQALARQRAQTSYTEHSFGRMPVMPGAFSTVQDAVTEQLKDHAFQAAQDKIAAATATVPLAGDPLQRALAKAQANGSTPDLVITMGPETELMTTSHAGHTRREVILGGSSEIIRANGRMAVRMSLKPQIAQMTLVTAEVGRATYEQVQTVRSSIKFMLTQLAHGGVELIGAAADAITQILAALSDAKTTAQLTKATVLMQSTSNRWQCEPDPLDAAEFGKRTEVRQLEDAAVGGVPAHVYLETRVFASHAPPPTQPVPPDDDDAPPASYEVQIRTFVRIADGLPLRSEFALPGGQSQRIEYDYAKVDEIAFPTCAEES